MGPLRTDFVVATSTGSVFEFLPYFDIVRKKWSPDELPWHIVVPSLPGYCFSDGPSTKVEWGNEDMAYVMNEVMVGLGLDGYIAHGGDIGSFLSRICAVQHDAWSRYCFLSRAIQPTTDL